MRLPHSIKSNVNLTVGRTPENWDKLNWQKINDNEYKSGKYRLLKDDRFGWVIAEVKNVNMQMSMNC